jgi:hypothetical protein
MRRALGLVVVVMVVMVMVMLTLIGAAAIADEDPIDKAVPKPPQMDEAKQLATQAASSIALKPEAKAAVKQQAAELEAEFDKAWEPVKAAIDHAKTLRDENDRNAREIEADDKQIEARRATLDHNNQGAVAAFNQDIANYNAKLKGFQEKADRDRKTVEQEVSKSYSGALEVALGPRMQAFRKNTQGLLAGRSPDCKDPSLGTAWLQLCKLAGQGEHANWDGSNTVDARGTTPMTDAQRKAEQSKPRSQLPKNFRTKAAPPPPPAKTTRSKSGGGPSD